MDMLLQHQNLYKPSGLNSVFPSNYSTFCEYIEDMRRIITHSRLDLEQAISAEQIISANLPREFQPPKLQAPLSHKKRGILIIHGLFYSPFVMQNLFDNFVQQNWLVRSILLTGHGTRPGDLAVTDYEQWIKLTRYAINSFQNEVDELFILGFSTGGNLAIHECLTNIVPIKGLILLAPALALKNSFAAISQLTPWYEKNLKRIWWYSHKPETDFARYQSIPMNAIRQVYLLGKKIRTQLSHHPFELPVMMIHTAEDEVVCNKAIKHFFMQSTHPLNQMLCYAQHAQSYSSDDKRIHYRSSFFPKQNILSFSHNCLAVAPWHLHYGAKSNVEKKIFYGALQIQHLLRYRLERLTFNPDFEYMVHKINHFINKVSGV